MIASEVRALTEPHRVKAEDRPERVVIGADGVLVGRVDPAHGTRASSKKGEVPGKGKLANFWKEVKTCYEFQILSSNAPHLEWGFVPRHWLRSLRRAPAGSRL